MQSEKNKAPFDLVDQVVISPVLELPREPYWVKLLSSNEYQRAIGMRFYGDDYSAATCAFMRRFILGCLLNKPFDKVSIVRQRTGKCISHDERFVFSSSSSGHFVATLCSLNDDVGINLKKEKLLSDRDKLASQILSPSEYRFWLNDGKKTSELFKLWSLKKARSKAEQVEWNYRSRLRSLLPKESEYGGIHSHRLPLRPPTWCSVYSFRPVNPKIILLGTSILENFLLSRFGNTQVVNQVIRKFSDMGLKPASIRFV